MTWTLNIKLKQKFQKKDFLWIFKMKKKRPLHAGKNEKIISLMKDERGSKIITKFGTAAPKMYYRVQKDDH